MTARRIDIVKDTNGWVAKTGGQPMLQATRKDDLVRKVAQTARASGMPTSVRIHGQNGRIQEERTYPRGADPRGSRG